MVQVEHFVGGLALYVLVTRVHVFRSIRVVLPVIYLAVLVYRFLHFDDLKDGSLLDILRTFLSNVISNEKVKSVVEDALGLFLLHYLVYVLNKYTSYNVKGFYDMITTYLFNNAKAIPFVKAQILKEHKKVEADLEKDLKPKSRALGTINMELPKEGWTKEEVLGLMKSCTKTEDTIWAKGHLSGAVYHGGLEHQKFLNECFGMYSLSNPLHADIWPSIMKFDAEIIAMTASLVKGGVETVCGCTSSGGTDSIILAVKAHRDYWRDNFQIFEPEIVASVSAHPALDKACDMLGIRLVKVAMNLSTMEIDLNALRAAIGPNTIMLYGSAPSYPYGTIDPISELSKIAKKYNIGLHVDCCLGGFVLPFAKRLGYNIPDFDFRLPGVTTMSLDTHKYGYTLKGSSVLLFRNNELRQSMYFCYSDWTGGLYTTPTIAGSRSGGLIAQCWASMMTMGSEGYAHNVKAIMDVVQRIAVGVNQIDGLRVFGRADAMIVAFGSTDPSLNIYAVGDKMHAKGWSLNSLQKPACIHICCTVKHVDKDKEFLVDLAEAVAQVRANPQEKSSNAALYGVASSLPPGPVADILKVYNDVVLKL